MESSLSSFPKNSRVKILTVQLPDSYMTHKLTSLGIHTGAVVVIHQHYPMLLLSRGQTLVGIRASAGQQIMGVLA